MFARHTYRPIGFCEINKVMVRKLNQIDGNKIHGLFVSVYFWIYIIELPCWYGQLPDVKMGVSKLQLDELLE